MGKFDDIPPKAQKIVGYWLLGCAGAVFGTVLIGGITRLTESGLSITQWNVIKGMRPPRTQAEWEEEFNRYKQFPEYKYLERDLSLDDFKRIFFWEYLHRMMGRTVGIVFGLPALYFLRKGWISRPMKPRLAIYFSLLLFQGALGWYMVRSGLYQDPNSTTVPRVSQYRLAAHLSSAVVLYALMLWSGLSHVLQPQQMPNTLQLASLRKFAHGAMSMVFFTLVSGAFVAGLDAGLVYNTWPKFADRWIPSDLFAQSPKWRNFFENATTAQFNHRLLGELTVGGILVMRVMCRKVPLAPRALLAVNCLTAAALAQLLLGIMVLLHHVPVSLASTHQAGALTLLSCALWLTHELRRVPK